MKTIAEFYTFFEAIPEDKWIKGKYRRIDGYCASGHLLRTFNGLMGYVDTLDNIFSDNGLPCTEYINDNGPHESAKQNILSALQVCAELGME